MVDDGGGVVAEFGVVVSDDCKCSFSRASNVASSISLTTVLRDVSFRSTKISNTRSDASLAHNKPLHNVFLQPLYKKKKKKRLIVANLFKARKNGTANALSPTSKQATPAMRNATSAARYTLSSIAVNLASERRSPVALLRAFMSTRTSAAIAPNADQLRLLSPLPNCAETRRFSQQQRRSINEQYQQWRAKRCATGAQCIVCRLIDDEAQRHRIRCRRIRCR